MSQSYQNAFILQSFGLDPGPQARARPPPSRPVPRRTFSTERPPPPQFNEDGSENIEWARHQSALRLKTKWEGIYERFRDAHLEDQDEIYLGRPGVAGDEPRIIRDRGSLRALEKQLRFGSFIRDEDLRAFSVVGDGEEQDADERPDWVGAPGDPPHEPWSMWSEPQPSWVQKQRTAPRAAAPAAAAPAPGAALPTPVDDPDLQDFLRQEARRREIFGDEEELDDVVDLRDARLGGRSRPRAPHAPRSASAQAASLERTASPDRAPSPDIAEELDIYRSVKREAIESMLRADTLGRCGVPYDLPGLAELLERHTPV